MTAAEIAPVRLSVRPWFKDHCFNGRIILPAVEAMDLLADRVQAAYPALKTDIIRDARFGRFLEIPPAADGIDIIIELLALAEDRVRASLLTRKQMKSMARMTQHCEMAFGGAQETILMPWPETDEPPSMQVSCQRIYQELVPFGPAYRTLQGQVNLGGDWALARLRTPDLPPDHPGMGSPFCLDGAMHAACVHGQLLVDFVPFPVGFDARSITIPALPGSEYIIKVRLRFRGADHLIYDLLILDDTGRIRETVLGLRMQDVSAGRIRPPAWIRAALPGTF